MKGVGSESFLALIRDLKEKRCVYVYVCACVQVCV